MRRDQFEHVLAAAADAVGLSEFVIIGSQAILGEIKHPPAALLHSMEVDMYPLADPSRSDEIDGAIGDGSYFSYTNGYYAHGVGPLTARAPAGWQDRLVRLDAPARVAGAPDAVAYCMERHDMILAKLVRGSERDVEYARAALDASILDPIILRERVPGLLEADQEHVAHLLRGLIGEPTA
ncbi:MAG TPA: DUF6036 family nucleotidyltransferase [Solirubrobacteraceae bacterium]|nr:DUF6036 family nucleotidyltransferase [Solirubrobacteraceae bacterium]